VAESHVSVFMHMHTSYMLHELRAARTTWSHRLLQASGASN